MPKNSIADYSDEELQAIIGAQETSSQDLSKMSDEELAKIAGVEESKDKGFPVGLAATGVGLAGAAGYGAFKAGQKIYEPFGIKKELVKELKGMQGTLGIEGTELRYIPKKLMEDKKDLISKAKLVNKDLSFRLKGIDSKEIPKASSMLANHIAANSSDFNKSLSKGYEKAIDSISDMAEQQGFKFTTKHFQSDVIDKVIDTAKNSGIPPESLARLENARKTLIEMSPIKDSYGKPFGTALSLKEANGFVGKLTNASPYSPESAILRKTWEEFLETNAPKDLMPQIQKLNAQYKPAAELRSTIAKFIEPKTGTFDTKRLSKYISDYAKGTRTGDVENAMNLLIKGNDIVPPMAGVGERFESLRNLGSQRGDLVNQIQGISKAAAKSEEILTTKINSANQLLSKLNQAQTRIDNRNVLGRTFKAVTGLGAKGLRAIGPIGMIGQAASLADNPADALRSMSFLPTQAESEKIFNDYLMQLDRDVTEGKITREQAAEKAFVARGGI